MATPIIRKARLIKRETASGCCEFEAYIPIGKVYLVDIMTQRKAIAINLETNTQALVDVVQEYQLAGPPVDGWLPVECLELL